MKMQILSKCAGKMEKKKTLKQNKRLMHNLYFFNKTWTCNYLLTEV